MNNDIKESGTTETHLINFSNDSAKDVKIERLQKASNRPLTTLPHGKIRFLDELPVSGQQN